MVTIIETTIQRQKFSCLLNLIDYVDNPCAIFFRELHCYLNYIHGFGEKCPVFAIFLPL